MPRTRVQCRGAESSQSPVPETMMTTRSLRFTILLISAVAASRGLGAQASKAPPPKPDAGADPYLWLEDVHGTRATAWVKAENAKTLGVLEKDRRYAGLYRDALAVSEASDRIPYVSFH